MAAAKARMGANDRASPSPYLASENDSDADSTTGGKRKSEQITLQLWLTGRIQWDEAARRFANQNVQEETRSAQWIRTTSII